MKWSKWSNYVCEACGKPIQLAAGQTAEHLACPKRKSTSKNLPRYIPATDERAPS